MTQEPAAKGASPGPDQLKLALERTFLAHERTLMAWLRTATSMIMFGFALYKFFYYVHQDRPPTPTEQIFGARTFGMCMMGIGVFTLALATLQHRRQIKSLDQHFPNAPPSLALIIAGLVATLGIASFIGALFRL